MRAATDVRERWERNSDCVRGRPLLWFALAAIGIAFLAGGLGSPRAGGGASTGKIAFDRSTDWPEETVTIWTARLDGSHRTLLTDAGLSYSSNPAWSPDGRQIVFEWISKTETDIDQGIWVMNANGSNQHALTTTKGFKQAWGGEYPPADTDPAWSPTGRTIAFTRYRPEYGVWAIWLMNRDGSNQRRLTRKPFDASAPAWSPDGKRLAFAGTPPSIGPVTYLYTIRTDGSGLRRLTQADISSVSWSPDGHTIAFDDLLRGVRLFDLRNGRSRRLVADGYNPSWLANGRSLLFCRRRSIYVHSIYSFSHSIYLISKDGGKPRFITNGENPSQQPAQLKTGR